MNPKISWYIFEDEDYTQDTEYYLGSFSPTETLEFKVQVWNNRYGQTSVDSVANTRLSIFFDVAEDELLLKHCLVSVNDSNFEKLEIIDNKGIINIGLLAGNYNNGLDTSDNGFNFKNITLKFDKLPINLKNGIKNMFLDLELD